MQGQNNPIGRVETGPYIQALVDYVEQTGDIGRLEEERNKLAEKLVATGTDGRTLISSSVNGMYFGWQATITIEEKFRALVQAIKILDNQPGSSPITFPDFSGL